MLGLAQHGEIVGWLGYREKPECEPLLGRLSVNMTYVPYLLSVVLFMDVIWFDFFVVGVLQIARNVYQFDSQNIASESILKSIPGQRLGDDETQTWINEQVSGVD